MKNEEDNKFLQEIQKCKMKEIWDNKEDEAWELSRDNELKMN